MLRLAGAALVWSGCALWGLQAALDLRGRTRLLESLVWALERMQRELVLSHLPLPELLQRIAEEMPGPGAQLFEGCVRLLRQEHSFAHAWSTAVEQAELPRQTRDCLSGLGGLLGRFDAEGQGESVSRVCRELEQQAARARQRQQAYGRVYGMLGITAGSFLAIVLL